MPSKWLLLVTLPAILVIINISVFGGSCSREHHGDLVIKANQVLTISDETFCIDGNITVEANAHLIIRNATLITKAKETQWGAEWTGLRVNEGARLDLFNVVLVADSGCGIWIRTTSNARVKILGVSLHGACLGIGVSKNSYATIAGSTVTDARVDEGGTLEIQDSTVSEIHISFDGPSRKVIEGLAPGHFNNWELVSNKDHGAYLSLRETTVQAWAIAVAGVADVTLKDSALKYIRVSLGQATGKISNVRLGHYTEWDLQGAGKLDCALNLRLVNSNVSRGWLIDFGGRANVEVSSSAIYRIRIGRTYVELHLQDVDLGGLETEDGVAVINFREVRISGGIYFVNAIVTLKGDFSILPTAHIDTYKNSTILRTYSVSVEDENGSPTVGASVELKAPNGQCLSATTNDNGVASFNLSFNDSNYSENWTLTVRLGDRTALRPVGFMSSSPVEIRISGSPGATQ